MAPPVLPEGDPNFIIQDGGGGYNSSDLDDLDNLDFAAHERNLTRNDEATFLPGSQENHGQIGTPIPRAGEQYK